MSWFADFSEFVRERVPLREHTWYRLGGPARWLAAPRDEAELSAVLRRCADAGVEVRFLGKGANLLVSDDGVDGTVIRLAGPFWERVSIEGEPLDCGNGDLPDQDARLRASFSGRSGVRMTAAAGADLMKVVKKTAHLGLAGIEGLAGIPASIGGAVRMNCGGRYGEIGHCVRSVRVVSPDGAIRERGNVRFGYRSTNLGADRVLGATLELTPGDPPAVEAEYERVWREKTSSQPNLNQRTAGCVFRNPPGDAAGRLIDHCGLKGTRVGGAEVSTVHANFIVAQSGATAADVLILADEVAQRVEAETGVRLELEVEVWGRRLKDAMAALRAMRRTDAAEAPAACLAGAGQGG